MVTRPRTSLFPPRHSAPDVVLVPTFQLIPPLKTVSPKSCLVVSNGGRNSRYWKEILLKLKVGRENRAGILYNSSNIHYGNAICRTVAVLLKLHKRRIARHQTKESNQW
ncbi:hypothetical protein F2P79_025370 [Pimephales promelas]|nr:hypothetical protein F2P79_025370 [Pimephales promelas]